MLQQAIPLCPVAATHRPSCSCSRGTRWLRESRFGQGEARTLLARGNLEEKVNAGTIAMERGPTHSEYLDETIESVLANLLEASGVPVVL